MRVAYGNGTALSGITRDAHRLRPLVCPLVVPGSGRHRAAIRVGCGAAVAVGPHPETHPDRWRQQRRTSTYSYDAAGRHDPCQHPSPRTGLQFLGDRRVRSLDKAAGANGNRTSFSDTKDGGTPTTVAYCYDNADRLTATTTTNPQAGAVFFFATAGNLLDGVAGL